MQLHDVHKGIHKRKKRKRIGRGVGSGHGKTSGKGHKGHSSSPGVQDQPDLRGRPDAAGPPRAQARVRERCVQEELRVVNLSALEERFAAGSVVDEKALRSMGWSRVRSTTASRSWPRAHSPSRWKCMRPSSAPRPPPRSPRPAARPSSFPIVRTPSPVARRATHAGRPPEHPAMRRSCSTAVLLRKYAVPDARSTGWPTECHRLPDDGARRSALARRNGSYSRRGSPWISSSRSSRCPSSGARSCSPACCWRSTGSASTSPCRSSTRRS